MPEKSGAAMAAPDNRRVSTETDKAVEARFMGSLPLVRVSMVSASKTGAAGGGSGVKPLRHALRPDYDCGFTPMSFRAASNFLTPSVDLPAVHSFAPCARSSFAAPALLAEPCFTISWSNCFCSAVHCWAGVIVAAIAPVDSMAAVTAIPSNLVMFMVSLLVPSPVTRRRGGCRGGRRKRRGCYRPSAASDLSGRCNGTISGFGFLVTDGFDTRACYSVLPFSCAGPRLRSDIDGADGR